MYHILGTVCIIESFLFNEMKKKEEACWFKKKKGNTIKSFTFNLLVTVIKAANNVPPRIEILCVYLNR